MRSPQFNAVYDACVLYTAPLRDLLICLGLSGRFRARWSSQIHDEWKRKLLINRPDLTGAQIERTSHLLDLAIPDGLVTGHETLSLPDRQNRWLARARRERTLPLRRAPRRGGDIEFCERANQGPWGERVEDLLDHEADVAKRCVVGPRRSSLPRLTAAPRCSD